jgi:hypothetical protein
MEALGSKVKIKNFVILLQKINALKAQVGLGFGNISQAALC